jgi:hypothetical protein
LNGKHRKEKSMTTWLSQDGTTKVQTISLVNLGQRILVKHKAPDGWICFANLRSADALSRYVDLSTLVEISDEEAREDEDDAWEYDASRSPEFVA